MRFQEGRETSDRIFVIRHLQDKCIENVKTFSCSLYMSLNRTYKCNVYTYMCCYILKSCFFLYTLFSLIFREQSLRCIIFIELLGSILEFDSQYQMHKLGTLFMFMVFEFFLHFM